MQWIISSPSRPPRHRCYTSRRKDIQKGKINHISHSSFADTHNAQLVKSLHQPFYNICIHKSVGKTVNSLYSRIYYFPSYLNASIWIRGSRHQQHNVKKKKKVNTCIKSTAAACDVLVFWQMALGRSSLRITLLNALMAAGKKTNKSFYTVSPRHCEHIIIGQTARPGKL